MKAIKDMNLAELAEKVRWLEYCVNGCVIEISDRLLELHELTRWISVSERMPTEEDADAEGYVLVRGVNAEGLAQHDIDLWHGLRYRNSKHWNLTHWQRITPPEDT